MIKQDHLKYQYYGPQPDSVPADPGYKPYPYDPTKTEVLFDLKRDPAETQNFIDDPAYAGLLGRFRQRRDELGYSPKAG